MSQPAYKILDEQIFTSGHYMLVPIRSKDRYKIMKWRNEQMFHLRQDKELTVEDQDVYFENTVAKLFNQDQPKQILFSFVKDKECIGYGGLVHINWKQRIAEVSFLMDTELEKVQFKKLWLLYLDMIEKVAFSELDLVKIYVYAFDLRPHLYPILTLSGFVFDERIKNKIQYKNNCIDVVIHSKYISDETY
ncbi:GNAT family N-acetyltransferase [bacterium]|nr:GNAT family N-acetyltransferase [bacterium]